MDGEKRIDTDAEDKRGCVLDAETCPDCPVLSTASEFRFDSDSIFRTMALYLSVSTPHLVRSFVCFPPRTCGLGLTLDPTCTPSRLTTQRSLRQVSVVACEELNAMSSVTAITSVIKRHGIFSLYDGVLPMAMRRSLDWGIRFYVSTNAKNMMLQRKREQGLPEEMALSELILCGFVGGAVSSMTYPVDSIVTNSQRPVPAGTPRDLLSVVMRMYKGNGLNAFTRGWAMKVCENSYHMAWMYGVGNVLYDKLSASLGTR